MFAQYRSALKKIIYHETQRMATVLSLLPVYVHKIVSMQTVNKGRLDSPNKDHEYVNNSMFRHIIASDINIVKYSVVLL